MEEQNPRLTTGSSPVYQRFISGLSPEQEALFVPGCRPAPFCLCKPFSCIACSGTDRGTKPAVDERFITGLSLRREALFIPGCRPLERLLFVSVNPFHAGHVREFTETPFESTTRTYHGQIGSRRPAERPGGVVQDRVPTKLFAQETKIHRTLQSIEETPLQCLSRRMEEQNQRLTTGLSLVYQRDDKRSLFLAADQWYDAFLSL